MAQYIVVYMCPTAKCGQDMDLIGQPCTGKSHKHVLIMALVILSQRSFQL